MMMVWIAGRDLYDFAPSLTKAVALRRERENSKAVQGILLPRLAEYGADPSRMRVLLTLERLYSGEIHETHAAEDRKPRSLDYLMT